MSTDPSVASDQRELGANADPGADAERAGRAKRWRPAVGPPAEAGGIEPLGAGVGNPRNGRNMKRSGRTDTAGQV